MAGKSHFQIFPFCLIPLVIILMTSGFLHAQKTNHREFELLSKNHKLRFLSSFDRVRLVELKAQARELELVLEYMVWPIEADRVKHRLLENYKEQVTQKPLDGALWQNVVHLQQQLTHQETELSYTLHQAVSLMEWRPKSYPALAYSCIHNFDLLVSDTQHACNDLLVNGAGRGQVGNVKKRLGMTESALEQRIHEAAMALQGSK